jgi:prepilin-type N-terminal cleavage/methylation domain-containing protein
MTRAHGFSLLELLLALTIGALLSAGVAVVLPPARAAFELTPAELDLQRRARAAIDVMMQSIRAAGGDAVAADGLGPLGSLVPAVIPLDPAGGHFRRLTLIAPQPHAAQAILGAHQAGGSGPLVLSVSGCPDASVLCGFASDRTALIADGSGRFDIFSVASADAVARMVQPQRSLIPPYVAGSVVVEAEVSTFQLEPEPDGSRTLVRVSGGGATQPVVDRVSDLTFEMYALDEAGRLEKMPVHSLTDGPWLRGEPNGDYDEDAFRIRAVRITLTVDAAPPASARRAFRFGVSLRNAR